MTLATPPPSAHAAARAVFISYAHADNESSDRAKRWLDRLVEQLQVLALEDVIAVDTDQSIQPGDDWHGDIQDKLNRAGAAVLLVSPAFLASTYIRNNELPVLLQRAKDGGLKIIPVILRPCGFAHARFKYPAPNAGPDEFTLASLQAAGSPNKALNEMSEGEQDRALLKVAEVLRSWFGGTHSAAASAANQPASFDDYRLARIAEWSQPRYQLDKRFTRMTLLLDQGPDAQGARWQAQTRPEPFDDLREVLRETDANALVLLGPPGCGKSTLLRRLELDLALDAVRDSATTAPLSWFLPLSRHRATQPGDPPPAPRDWLEHEWRQRFPDLPGLTACFRQAPFLLLLDAVNELPHTSADDYRQRVSQWRDFLAELAISSPQVRAVFTCRSLDYSAQLSTPDLPVPQVRIEPLGDERVEQFLLAHDAERGRELWQQLRGTPQLDLFRSPFYLRLLLAHAGDDGRIALGRDALFTGFVRQALKREIDANHPLFASGALLDDRDYQRVLRNDWRNGFELPSRPPALLTRLSELAFRLQEQRGQGDESRVRTTWDEAVELLGGGTEAERLLKGAEALNLIEEQWDEVFFVHQLFQEYFAARALATNPLPELARTAWKADEVQPSLADTLAGLADSDPLPAAPATGWEETMAMAAAMTPNPAAFITELEPINLPLAGRCAAQADVQIPGAQRQRIQQALIARSRDPGADLRAGIAAARALGELGDPRFERHTGPDGDYLLPPMIAIPGGTYTIGSDEGLYPDESPAHRVTLAPFSMGKFPVTNAEWQCFMAADGYDDERWWTSEAARRWQSGEDTAEGAKQQLRDERQFLQANPKWASNQLSEGKITSKQVETFEWYRTASDAEFEAQLDDWYPPGRQTQPDFWNDSAFNHPAQPVVGVCWYEARAYAEWLSAQTGQTFRLPTEAEWEASARGSDAKRYPWGDAFDAAHCNAFETHVRATTPIGIFSSGDTPTGLTDLAGNVWDWTTSLYRDYPYQPDDGREAAGAVERRVLRGGSWYGAQDFARCAYRNYGTPDDRGNDIGFRLVLFSPIPDH